MGETGPYAEKRHAGPATQDHQVREDERLADEENGFTSLEAEAADNRMRERMGLRLEQDQCRRMAETDWIRLGKQ